jgi:hypothetical protein
MSRHDASASPAENDRDARVARLEREGRVWRAVAVLSMLVAAVAWVVPSASAQGQTLKADTIYARSIYVVPDLANTSTAATTGISLLSAPTGNYLYVSSPQNKDTAAIAVSLMAAGGVASINASNQVASVQVYSGDGASVSMHGPTSTLSISGATAAGPFLLAGVGTGAQSATVSTFDASHASASMGFAPNQAGAFRAYSSSGQTDPDWTAP